MCPRKRVNSRAWILAPHWSGSHTGDARSWIESDGDPLYQVAGDTPVPPVVELGGAGVGVADQVLDIFDPMLQKNPVNFRVMQSFESIKRLKYRSSCKL